MKSLKLGIRLLILPCWAVGIFFAIEASAETTPKTGGTKLQTQPIAGKSGVANPDSSVISSCTMQMGIVPGMPGSAGASQGLGIDKKCEIVDPVNKDALTVETACPAGEAPDVTAWLKQNKSATENNACLKNLATAIGKEIDCLQKAFQNFNSQIQSYQAAFVGEVTQVGKQVQDNLDAIADAEYMMGELVGPDGKGGLMGATAAQIQSIQAAEVNATATVTALENGIQQMTVMKKSHAKAKQLGKAARFRSCMADQLGFGSKDAGITNITDNIDTYCRPFDASSKNRPFLCAIYQENAKGNKNISAIETKDRKRGADIAADAQKQLKWVLEQMPVNLRPGMGAQPGQPVPEDVASVTSSADFMSKLGKSGSAMVRPGLTLSQFLDYYAKKCDSMADQFVNSDSFYTGFGEDEKAFERSLVYGGPGAQGQPANLGAQGVIKQSWGAFDNAIRSLVKSDFVAPGALQAAFGKHTPTECETRSASNNAPEQTLTAGRALNCVKQVRDQLSGMLEDKKPDGSPGVMLPFKVHGKRQGNEFAFTCVGLNLCLTKMSNTADNIKRARDATEQYMKTKVTQYNSDVKSRIESAKQSIQSANQGLYDLKDKIKKALGGIGLEEDSIDKIKFEGVEGKELEVDEPSPPKTGLYKTSPLDMKAILGMGMNPPLVDTAKDPLAGFNTALGAINKKYQENATKISESKAAIAKLQSDCKKKFDTDLKADIESAQQCFKDACSDQTQEPSALKTLLDAIDGLEATKVTNKSSIENLTSGIRRDCDSKIKAQSKKYDLACGIIKTFSGYSCTGSITDAAEATTADEKDAAKIARVNNCNTARTNFSNAASGLKLSATDLASQCSSKNYVGEESSVSCESKATAIGDKLSGYDDRKYREGQGDSKSSQ